jgi:dephospho-CoA kinase
MEQRGEKILKKLALLGNTGVGKDTCVKIIQNRFSHLKLSLIQLAAPLYEAQNAIYQICGKEKGPDVQDGVLLNFLGQHMRLINPYVLKESFLRILEKSQADLIICRDVRPLDVPFVREAGFFIVNIATDPSLCLERRKARGDLSLGASNHKTEVGLSAELYDTQIMNNSTLDNFERETVQFLQGWLR